MPQANRQGVWFRGGRFGYSWQLLKARAADPDPASSPVLIVIDSEGNFAGAEKVPWAGDALLEDPSSVLSHEALHPADSRTTTSSADGAPLAGGQTLASSHGSITGPLVAPQHESPAVLSFGAFLPAGDPPSGAVCTVQLVGAPRADDGEQQRQPRFAHLTSESSLPGAGDSKGTLVFHSSAPSGPYCPGGGAVMGECGVLGSSGMFDGLVGFNSDDEALPMRAHSPIEERDQIGYRPASGRSSPALSDLEDEEERARQAMPYAVEKGEKQLEGMVLSHTGAGERCTPSRSMLQHGSCCSLCRCTRGR